MKKRTLKKLSLHRMQVAHLSHKAPLQGGNGGTVESVDVPCLLSFRFTACECETLHLIDCGITVKHCDTFELTCRC
ncbi:hypothetical protein [Ascidiimonas aurantiaca]|uniref:hypothetical protein n=1 Tax=Ascidiimonas aurantiaca TaxID=1685432 RepID=UPI0030EECF2B